MHRIVVSVADPLIRILIFIFISGARNQTNADPDPVQTLPLQVKILHEKYTVCK
jgi:hypothetical protein